MDSRYNMTLSKDRTNVALRGCRDYIGIGQFSGKQLYFKFYDGVVYKGISADSVVSLTRTEDGSMPEVPYQKIECAYVNRYSSANLHKSRFFSVKMMNTELNQYENV